MRIATVLMAPDADSAGGGADEPPADDDEPVTISRAELAELRARAGAMTGFDAKLAAARDEWAAVLRGRDVDHSRSIAEAERKATALEQAYKSALLDRELATALAGKPLVPGAADQLIHLWRDAFEVVDDDGTIRVVSREGRGVGQAVADRLAGPEFAHFCLPTSRGGTGTRGQNRGATSPPTPLAPRTLGEAVLHQWRESAAQVPSLPGPPGWGRRR